MTTFFLQNTLSANQPWYIETGVATAWADSSAGSGVTGTSMLSVDGPTSGVFCRSFYTHMLSADVTISGTITFNLWGYESSMSANAGFDVLIQRCDALGDVISTILRSERGVELATATAVNNWTAIPTSTDMKKGDRIKITVFFNDVGTMGGNYTLWFRYNGATFGADGYSYVAFTESINTMTAPSGGTVFWPRTLAADADFSADDDLLLSLVNGTTDTQWQQTLVDGPTTGVQVANSGTNSSWWTKPLSAATLTAGDLIGFNLYGYEVAANANCAWRVKVEKTAGDGSSPVTVVDGTYEREFPVGTSNINFGIQIPSTVTIADGERLHLTLYLDDTTWLGNMSSATSAYAQFQSATYYSWVRFPATLTEYTPPASTPPHLNQYPQLLAQ